MRVADFFQFGRFRGPFLAAFILTLAISLFFYFYQDVPLDLDDATRNHTSGASVRRDAR